MNKRIRLAIAAAAVVGGFTVSQAGAVSAAHCNDLGMPGNSDFSVHVRANNGPGGHNEGDHKGWSSCR